MIGIGECLFTDPAPTTDIGMQARMLIHRTDPDS